MKDLVWLMLSATYSEKIIPLSPLKGKAIPDFRREKVSRKCKEILRLFFLRPENAPKTARSIFKAVSSHTLPICGSGMWAKC